MRVTDHCTNLLCLISSCGLAGSDCPDRLVSDYHGLYLISGYALQICFNLQMDPVYGMRPALSKLQSLAAAKDRGQAGCSNALSTFLFSSASSVSVK